jgi:spermidine/putrescine transport system substrate-binding protein
VPVPVTRLHTRRSVLRLGLGAALTAPLLSACGGSGDDEGGGPLVFVNFPEWIGAGQYEALEQAHGITVREVAGLTAGAAATATQIRQNTSSYDMALAPIALAGQLEAGDLLDPFDPGRVPNLAGVPQRFRELFPYGIPTDFGKVGFGYRRDLMSEEPTSWADMWRLAPSYSGQITWVDYDSDVLGSVLRSLGHSANSVDETELAEASAAMAEIKPHLQAIVASDFSKALIEGTAVMALSYDYDIAVASQENPDIVWVAPTEGMTGYVEGWVPIKGTERIDDVYTFMDFHLEPEQYADFINTTGSAYLLPEAEPLIDETISGNPALSYDEETLALVEFEAFKGEGVALRNRAWEEFKAA